MEIEVFIVGVMMIGIGFFVKHRPNYIAGYNTMPEAQKENVDIDGLSTFMQRGLIIIGLTIIIGGHIFKWIGLPFFADFIIKQSMIVGVAVIIIYAQKYDHNSSKKSKLITIFVGLLIIFGTEYLMWRFLP